MPALDFARAIPIHGPLDAVMLRTPRFVWVATVCTQHAVQVLQVVDDVPFRAQPADARSH